MLLLVGVVDSAAVPPPVVGAPPAADWPREIWDGLCLKTREPLRCLGPSLSSLCSAGGLLEPGGAVQRQRLSAPSAAPSPAFFGRRQRKSKLKQETAHR